MTVLQDWKDCFWQELSHLANCGWVRQKRRRSRRKAADANKENVAGRPVGAAASKTASLDHCALHAGGFPKSHSVDFSVCDAISLDDLRRLARLPVGMELNEWIASHVLGYFDHVNALYGAVAERCTAASCPVMVGTGGAQYSWVDERGKKCKYSAPQYVDFVMSFVAKTLLSEDAFPTKFGNDYPAGFQAQARRVCRLLWHVLAHVFVAHWDHLQWTNLRAQAAALATDLYAFCDAFALLEPKEQQALERLVAVCRPPPVDVSEQPTCAPPVAAAIPPPPPSLDCANRKSGSWGGSENPRPFAAALQPCAQTA